MWCWWCIETERGLAWGSWDRDFFYVLLFCWILKTCNKTSIYLYLNYGAWKIILNFPTFGNNKSLSFDLLFLFIYFNKVISSWDVSLSRASCFSTMRAKGNYFWKKETTWVGKWLEGVLGVPRWLTPSPLIRSSPNLIRT